MAKIVTFCPQRPTAVLTFVPGKWTVTRYAAGTGEVTHTWTYYAAALAANMLWVLEHSHGHAVVFDAGAERWRGSDSMRALHESAS